MNLQTVELAPLDFRAAIGDIHEDSRTVELTFSTGADTMRFDWNTGKRYIERLSLDPKHIRLQRLRSGAPLLDSHSAWSLSSQIGVVERAEVDGKKGTAAVRFPKAEDDDVADKIYRKVRDKIVRNVSVGYRVHRFEESQGKGNELPLRLATDWEPFEISMVPMPVDIGAQTRGEKPREFYPCVIVRCAVDDADRIRRYRLAAARY